MYKTTVPQSFKLLPLASTMLKLLVKGLMLIPRLETIFSLTTGKLHPLSQTSVSSDAFFMFSLLAIIPLITGEAFVLASLHFCISSAAVPRSSAPLARAPLPGWGRQRQCWVCTPSWQTVLLWLLSHLEDSSLGCLARCWKNLKSWKQPQVSLLLLISGVCLLFCAPSSSFPSLS